MSVVVSKAGEQITLAKGAAMTAAYRTSHPGEIKAHLVGIDRFNEILQQTGCEGIRMYYGLDEGEKELVLVGVDKDGNDMTSGVIVDRTVRCPPYCAVGSALNE